jgi:hypothetical protein
MANQSIFTAPLLSLVIAAPVVAQAPPPVAPSWAGWAQCQISIQAPGYAHRETHLWTVTGAGTPSANMEIYPASWTVTGDGSLQRVNGPTTVSARWTVNGTLPNVTIGTTRHIDRVTVQRWTNHGPARSGLTGTEISTTNGVPRSRPVILDVQQWAFPAIETGPTSTRATGSSTVPFDGLRGPMNPPSGALGTAACTWDFARGGVPPSAPPSSTPAVPAAPSSGTPVPAGAPAASSMVSLVYPNGGETLGAGDGAVNRLVRFRYGAAAASQLFDLDLSTDAGGTWTSLRRGAQPSLIDGIFLLQLPLPRTSTSRALVRVTPAGAPAAADVSDAPFTIVQHSIKVTTPVAPMAVGQRATISWTHDFPAAERRFRVRLARLNLSASESIVWLGEVEGTGSPESFTFTVPGPATTQAQIAIITPDEVFAAFGPPFDISDASSSSSSPTPAGAPPSIITVTPSAAPPGTRALPVSITAAGTHFVQGVSYVDFGALAGATSLTITSPTTATATINVDPAAPPGPRTVTMTTPSPDGTSEVVSRVAAFTVGSSQPAGSGSPPGTSPSSGTPSAGPPPTSGRYRITATGVYFHNAEADNPGPAIGDGKGDEIYLTSYAQVYDRRSGNQLSAGPLLRTPVHGDLSGAGGGARVRAGSATPAGGIATGDAVQLQMPGSTPVVLWEGQLRDGIDVAVLRPVLWEFDGNEAAWYTVYAQRFPPAAPRQMFDLPVVQAAILRAGVAFELVPGATMTGAWVADTQDHPIGTVLTVSGTGVVAGTWTDRVLTLTREKLEPWLTAAGGAGRVELRVSGEIHLPGAGPLEGQHARQDAVADYTLNLVLERRP